MQVAFHDVCPPARDSGKIKMVGKNGSIAKAAAGKSPGFHDQKCKRSAFQCKWLF
jgi:hypothetical protein